MSLESDISGMEIGPGDFIHVQFRDKEPRPESASVDWHLRRLGEQHHILNQNALFGRVTEVGNDITHKENPNYDKESEQRVAECVKEAEKRSTEHVIYVNANFDPVELKFRMRREENPDLYTAIDFLYDTKGRRWNISYTTKTGHRILINGVVINEVDKGVTGLDVVTEHFPQKSLRHLDDQILLHTNYLEAVGASVFVGMENIRAGIEKIGKGFYLPTIEILHSMLSDENRLTHYGTRTLTSQVLVPRLTADKA